MSPYIPKSDRWAARQKPQTIGELNYALTQLVLDWLRERPAKYHYYNAAIGALECAKLELYRRLIAVYEEKKIAENGDVYDVSATQRVPKEGSTGSAGS